MALTDFLTQIADAIRSKDGTTEPIVATDFPKRILDIPSGGGSSIKVATGTIVPSEDVRILWSQYASYYYEIEHGLGVVPNFAIMYDADFTDSTNYPAYANSFINLVDFGLGHHRSECIVRTYNDTGGLSTDVVNNSNTSTSDRYDTSVYRFGSGNNSYLRAGRTYRWIVGRAE